LAEGDDVRPVVQEYAVRERDEGAGPHARHGLEHHGEVGWGAHRDGLQRETQRLRRGLDPLQVAHMGGVRCIPEDGHQGGL
jgi:hypothetical protein